MKRNVAALAGALALLATTPVLAQSIKVERIEVARPGIYAIEVGKPIPDAGVATGNRVEASAYKSVKVGTQIEAKSGTIIGAELTIVGTPRRGKVPLKVVWRYPAPGLTNPETKATRTSDEYTDTQLVGEKFPIFWGLTQDWHAVPGTWTLEVFQGDRKLVTQEFQLSK
jgi:Domain of unknown function (DUF3859)